MKTRIGLLLALALTLVTLGTERVALAAAPSNDNFANATLIPTAGFVDTINTSEATLEANEPTYCYPISNSVWYRFSAGNSTYNVYFDTTGSDYPASMTLYLATPDGLQVVACNGTSPMALTASPGETWYVQVTGTPDGATGTPTTASGNLVFTVTTVQYVPIDVSFTIDSRGTVNAAGDIVVITGTITCSRAASLSIGMTVTQIHARRLVASAGGGADAPTCGPTPQRWTAAIYDGGPIRFGSGAATVDANAFANDDHGNGNVQIVGASLRLKH